MNIYEEYGKLMVELEILQSKINAIKQEIQKDIGNNERPRLKRHQGEVD